jgi:hypothetical protein
MLLFVLGVLFALAASAAVATPARADLVLYAQEAGVNGGAITQIAMSGDFSSASFNGVYGDFTLSIFGSTSNQGVTLSSLLGADVAIQNNAATTKTITLFASQNDYALPIESILAITSGMSGTVNTGTLGGAGVFQAYADPNNILLGTAFTNGLQSASFNGNTFNTGTATGVFARGAGPYSLSAKVTATVSGGGEGNFSDQVNAAAIPEPGGHILLGITAVIAWLRIRGLARPRPASASAAAA